MDLKTVIIIQYFKDPFLVKFLKVTNLKALFYNEMSKSLCLSVDTEILIMFLLQLSWPRSDPLPSLK